MGLEDDYMDVTALGDSHRTRVRMGTTITAAAREAIFLRPRPGSFRCEGGKGHDDPDNSGLCIRCGGVSDGGPLSE